VSAGVGYAITSFTRYALGVVGILIAFGMIGLRWNQVQWLASAAVLGLSFGLQEIFSNFVSGVLMLVEQPVRVGDVVTVNGVTGRVTRIQIRATTITDWDRRDLVIPNKAFITGQFSNWTLSDNRTRQIVEIGVAYGSDYRLVERLLLAAASGDPDIATDPMPSVVLKAFADSSVTFDLRFVIEDVGKISSTTHQVKLRIAELFAENGVEIPFPQRDLHLKSVEPEAMKRWRRVEE
jgi:potassium efflux system protein